MYVSDAELALFQDWQPGESITIDANSVGMLIQEVRKSRAALRAYSALDDMHDNCSECEETMQDPACCEICQPFADTARLQMRAIIEQIGL